MTTLLSRYKIIKQIGAGGFGNTYLAEDLALPGKPLCVVKHLKPNRDPDVLSIAQRLFEEEAKVLHNLGKHEQIPSLAAHFQEDGEFYLVQEFVDGHDLNQEIIPGKKLSEKQTIKLLTEILEILAVIHQENIIHRDIKPSNIMRRRQDGKIVLIDFGAVKEIGAYTITSKEENSLTVGIGTPGYMPDEQANGRPKLASDIYAVGMIGIQAVTGLVAGKFDEDSTTGEIIWRNHAQVSDRFAEVLNKMVRDHFSQRYQNATEALQALIPPPTTVFIPPCRDFSPKIMVGLGLGVAISFASVYVINYPSFNQGSSKVSSTSQRKISQVFSTSQMTIQLSTTKANFRNLDQLLAARKWQEADLETWKLMKRIANREKQGYLLSEDYKNFPGEELRILDQLWVKYSNGRFGFSVQKQVWIESGGIPGVYDDNVYKKFGDSVGWRKNGNWLDYSDINFDATSLKGQLPVLQLADGGREGWRRVHIFSFL